MVTSDFTDNSVKGVSRSYHWQTPKQFRHCEKAFSADEAIFIAKLTGMKDCFVVPSRNDDFSSRSMPLGCHSYWSLYNKLPLNLTNFQIKLIL